MLKYKIDGYPSIPAAAKALGISAKTAYTRFRKGLPLDAKVGITREKARKPVTFNGVTYPSRGHAARALGLPDSTLCHRLKAGIPLDACRWPGRLKGTVEYGGVKYDSMHEACLATGLTRGALRYRLEVGKTSNVPAGCKVVIGEGSAALAFESIRRACEYMGIPYGRVQNRRFKGLALRDCFEGSEKPWPVPRTTPPSRVRWLSPEAKGLDYRKT